MSKLFVFLFSIISSKGKLVDTTMSKSGKWGQMTFEIDGEIFEISIMKKDEE